LAGNHHDFFDDYLSRFIDLRTFQGFMNSLKIKHNKNYGQTKNEEKDKKND